MIDERLRQHTYRVVWSAEDEAFVATCDEFPSLSWLDEDPIEAISGLLAVMFNDNPVDDA